MNRLKYILYMIPFIYMFSACSDYLDKQPDDQVTEEEVFTRYDLVDGLVTNLYDEARDANKPLIYFSHFSTAPITDEATASSHEGAIPHQFHIGNWGPSQGIPGEAGQYWASLYENVRKANVILEGIEKYNTPDNPRDGKEGDLQRRIGETHFLRAYHYFLLVRTYGEVPYTTSAIYPGDDMTFVKESVHTIVDKICEDATIASQYVYGVCPDSEFGRVDKGACLGLIAMARWLAATPLWNGGDLPNDTRVYSSEYTYDAQRWEAARDAAKAVIDLTVDGNQRYSLYTDYTSDDFTDSRSEDGTNANNKMVPRRLWEMFYNSTSIRNEWVWFVTRNKDTGWSGDMLPPSQSGHARQRPLQEQVDEYEIIINGYGYPIYSDEGKGVYDDGNPYINRDPRFYRDVVYHGSTYREGNVINTAEGNDAVADSYLSAASHSGYYHRKFIKENWDRSWHIINGPAIFRLPAFIYNYCEAVNNTTGPTQEIYDMMNEVRERSFMAPMPLAAKSNKELMDEYIQRERRVEFYYENFRVWNCRLYLEPDVYTAEEQTWQALGSPVDYYPYPKTQRTSHGMRPVEDPDGKIVVDGKNYRMERIRVMVGEQEFRIFQSPRHYLFPIMDDELKRTPALVQNPGW